MALLVTLRSDPSPHVRFFPPATRFANTTTGRPLHSMRTPAGAGFLGSPFPPRSRPGWPASGSGNSPVPWSKT